MRFGFSFLKASLALAILTTAASISAYAQSASFTGFDTTHKGNWVGAYGADGYIIANGADTHPGYVTAAFNGSNSWTWENPSTDPRALYSSASSGSRIASTLYTTSTFNIDLNVSGSAQVALYCVDLDTTSRSQTISILNASNNAVLDSRTVSNFTGGVWAVWTVSGHVVVRVTNNPGSFDAVVSGLFFKSLTPVAPPTVTMNAPVQDPVTGPVTLTATATSNAAIASVQFQVDGVNIGAPVTSGSGSTYSVQWTNPVNGTHSLTAIATDSQSQSATSAPVSVNVLLSTPTRPAATFVKFDTTTIGNWPGTYGGDGYLIANGNTVLPAYATESATGAQAYTWYASTTDPRALRVSPTSNNRIASTFFSTSTFSFDVNISDGQTHQIALYCLDYETNQRKQTITIIDPTTQAVLSTQPISGMYGGVYAVWNISGHVVIKVAYTGGLTSVVSGVFFGGMSSTTPPPTVTIATPAERTVSNTVSVTANAVSSVGIASVQYFVDGSALGSSTSGPSYAYSWNTTTASNGSHTLTAVATDTLGQPSVPSAGVTVNVSNAVATPPSISITAPAAGTVSSTITIQATASATSPATMQSVQFKIDSTPLSTITGAGPYSATWNTTTISNGNHVITAIATDSLNHTASTSVTVNVSNSASSSTAALVKTDFTTAGNWVGNYGGDGYLIANSTSALPSYAQVIPSASALPYTWNNPSTDPRALYTSTSATSRIASTYYTSSSFSFDVNLTDGQTHQIALYSLDIETSARSQTITIQDYTSNAVLASLPVSHFNTGIWTVWNVSGHVVIKVTYNSGLNAVLGGIFFGGVGAPTGPPPTAILNSPAAGTVSGTVNITSTASSSVGIASVQYYLDGTVLGSPVAAGPSYTFTWDTTSTTNGSHTLTAVATDTQNQKGAASPGITVNVSNTVISLPTVSITNPTGGTVLGTVNIQASASATAPATMTSVQFSIDGQSLATVNGSGPSFSTSWNTTNLTNGSHTISALATDSTSHTKSTSATVNVQNIVVSPNTAQFVKADAATKGNWVGVYGADGYIIPNDANNPPGYVNVVITGAGTYTWFPSTTDVRAPLINTSSSNRIASTFYAQSSETFDLNFTDGQLHQVALYCLDYDTSQRSQTIQVIDATTLNILDTQTLATFNGGVYEVWNVTGHVLLKVTNTSSLNAAVSGLFFRSFTGITPPTATFSSPASGETVAGPVTMSVNASSAQGIASVQFQIDGTNVGAPVVGPGPVFTSHWASPLVSNGTHTISAIVTDNLGLRTTASIPISVSNGPAPTPAATLASIDSYTSGSWKGVYGQDGEIIANDSTNPPFYATVNFVNTDNPPFTWHAGDPTTDLPGLEKVNSNQRIGATFFKSTPDASFDIDVNFVDYQQHELSLYFVDWHHNVRAQTVTIMDANTRAPLYSQYFTDFSLGVYYTWNITGHVIINIKLEPTPWNPTSAVVSALFFQPPSVAARPTVSIVSPTPSQTVTKTVTLSVAASSSIGVSSIQYELDGYPLGASVTSGSPFNFQWNTATATNGTHQLNAIAVDSSNHAITSAPILVTVSN
jgi:hypothetical protein